MTDFSLQNITLLSAMMPLGDRCVASRVLCGRSLKLLLERKGMRMNKPRRLYIVAMTEKGRLTEQRNTVTGGDGNPGIFL